MRGRWLLLAGMMIACGTGEDIPNSGDQSPPSPDAALTQERPAEPASLADLAPGDTAGALALIRHTIDERNAAAATAVRRDSVMPPEGYREPRRLTLWTIDAVPIKLVASEPNDAGLMTGETIAWFVGGEVRAVQEPFDILYFEADRLVLWTDEGMVPLEAPESDRMLRERAVLDSLKARLAVFGRGYP